MIDSEPPDHPKRDAAPLDAAFFEARLGALAPGGAPPEALALAVSGGGDSLALLLLAMEWAEARVLNGRGAAPRLAVLTVDHDLRPESRSEAERVAELVARRAEAAPPAIRADALWSCDILVWRRADPIPDGNLQAAARSARYRLMAERRRALGIGPLLTAHSADDAAETFLLRLARGSGVDGLALMADRRVEDSTARPPLEIWRPLLGVSGAELRDVCRARGVAWAEDPSNQDARYQRVAARHALDALAPLGLTRARLLRTAKTMARAREALERAAEELLSRAARLEAAYGALALDLDALAAAPREIALRAIARCLAWTSGGAPYPPRLDALEDAFDAARGARGAARTLQGCVIAPDGAGALWIGREPRAAPRVPLAQAEVWDGRFRIEATLEARRLGGEIAPLGATAPPGASAPSAPALIRSAAPAIWRDGALIGAPTLGAPAPGVEMRALSPRWEAP